MNCSMNSNITATNQLFKNQTPIRFGNEDIAAVDLFCGIGGLTHGLVRGGINVVAGIDIDTDCQFAYESNNTALFIEKDVTKLQGIDLKVLFGKAKLRLLAGCAPCQPFSTYSQKGRNDRNDMKWALVSEFGRLIEDAQPEFVTMENVPQLQNHNVFREFLEKLEGYSIWHAIVDCSSYGVPQTRKRLVLLASRIGQINLIPPTSVDRQQATVRKAIEHLPRLSAGEGDLKDSLHVASRLSDLNLRRIIASKPGGTWRDWDKSLLAKCHVKDTGKTYPSVYGRMDWEAPAPTITTQCFGYGNGRFGHPEQNRAISLREAAILQTFPENYRFLAPDEPISFAKLGRLIGNAVPVRMGEVVAQSLIEHVQKNTK